MAATNMVSAGGFSGVSFHLRRCPQGVASVLWKKVPIFHFWVPTTKVRPPDGAISLSTINTLSVTGQRKSTIFISTIQDANPGNARTGSSIIYLTHLGFCLLFGLTGLLKTFFSTYDYRWAHLYGTRGGGWLAFPSAIWVIGGTGTPNSWPCWCQLWP